MVNRRKDVEPNDTPRRPPATTPEGREHEMIALAFNVVEDRLRNGTATSQETVHFLRLGTEDVKLQREKLRKENILLEARAEQLGRVDRMEELLDGALKAFRGYTGQEEPEEEYDGP